MPPLPQTKHMGSGMNASAFTAAAPVFRATFRLFGSRRPPPQWSIESSVTLFSCFCFQSIIFLKLVRTGNEGHYFKKVCHRQIPTRQQINAFFVFSDSHVLQYAQFFLWKCKIGISVWWCIHLLKLQIFLNSYWGNYRRYSLTAVLIWIRVGSIVLFVHFVLATTRSTHFYRMRWLSLVTTGYGC